MHHCPVYRMEHCSFFWNNISERGACWWSLTFQHHCGPAVPESDLQTSPCPGFPQPPANGNSVHSSPFVAWAKQTPWSPSYLGNDTSCDLLCCVPDSFLLYIVFPDTLPIPSCLMAIWKCSYHLCSSAFFPAGVWNSRPRPIVRTTHPEAADFRRRAFKGGQLATVATWSQRALVSQREKSHAEAKEDTFSAPEKEATHPETSDCLWNFFCSCTLRWWPL